MVVSLLRLCYIAQGGRAGFHVFDFSFTLMIMNSLHTHSPFLDRPRALRMEEKQLFSQRTAYGVNSVFLSHPLFCGVVLPAKASSSLSNLVFLSIKAFLKLEGHNGIYL